MGFKEAYRHVLKRLGIVPAALIEVNAPHTTIQDCTIISY